LSKQRNIELETFSIYELGEYVSARAFALYAEYVATLCADDKREDVSSDFVYFAEACNAHDLEFLANGRIFVRNQIGFLLSEVAI
jgi:hypothetical protein